MGGIPKTIAEHKAEGTYRADRHGGLDLPVSVPEPGRHLSDRATEIYQEYAGRLVALGVVSELDGIVLTEAATIADELEQCRRELAESNGLVIKGSTGTMIANPLCVINNQLRGTLYKYLTQLGLTPRSRTGLKVEPKTHDPLDDFM